MSGKASTIVAAVSGGIIILGSLLPWVSVSVFFASLNVGGMSGDGRITIVCGFILLFLSLLLMQKHLWYYVLLAMLGALTSLGTSLYDIVHISKLTHVSSLAHVSVGIGLWLVVIGSIIGCAAIIKSIFLFGEVADEDDDTVLAS